MLCAATRRDRKAGTLPTGNLRDLHQSIQLRGYAVVGGLISERTRELLLESVLEDVDIVRSGQTSNADGASQIAQSEVVLTPHEQRTGVGHLQLGLRRHAPYVHTDVVANPLIESVVAEVLGAGAWLGFYNGNVNCPGSATQPLHFDRPYSWQTREQAQADGQPWPPPTTTLSCSLALTDITVATGATEFYPGSHRETEVAAWTTNRIGDRPDLLAKWGPPRRMEMPAGAVCFRDPRMWHRGVPNVSDGARPMPALTYHSVRGNHWRGRIVHDVAAQDRERLEADATLKLLDEGGLGDGRLVFHASAGAAFAEPSRHGVNRNVRFVTGRVNHLIDAHVRGGARFGAA